MAHHVSAIGVQAAAARRVLDHDPEAAKGALGHIETGSREAVGQMRSLLGTLRRGEAGTAGEEQGGAGHAPQPSLADIPALVASRDAPSVIERTPMIIRMVVVLPAPLPPRKPYMLPRGTSIFISSTAVKSLNCLVRFESTRLIFIPP